MTDDNDARSLIQIFKIVKGLEDVDLVVKIGRSRPGLLHIHQVVKKNCVKCLLRLST